MKKTIISHFYNEEYLLPWWLNHHKKYFDHGILINYASTDKSVEIINSFPNTEVIEWDSNGQVRDDLYLEIKNNIWKQSRGKCDYVIVGDADEFLYHDNMIDFLTRSKKNDITLFKPEGYHMIGDEDLDLNYNDNLLEKVKYGIIGSSNDKLMMFNPNKIQEINYMFGCHQANPKGIVNLYQFNDLKMLHYKYLGLKDFIPKQKLRGDRLSEFNKQRGLGMYYLYDENKHKEEYKTFIEKRKKVL